MKSIKKYINLENLENSMRHFKNNNPFDHCIVDNFFTKNIALKLESEFISFASKEWHLYSNAIEEKKTCNNYNIFPSLTYKVFNLLYSEEMLKILSKYVNTTLYADYGLNGGGWHIHGNGGNSNPHLDYSLHPKLSLQRKLNIIIYMSNNLIHDKYGGQLGLYSPSSSNKNQHGKLEKEINPHFNRAIIFDTTQNSWHGLSRKFNAPDGIYRKSIAIYYLCIPSKSISNRGKALFSPRPDQEKNQDILTLIKNRSSVSTAHKVWR